MPYDEQDNSFSMRTPKTLIEAGFVKVALVHAIMELLDRLAAAHGNEPGPWLDELEQVLITGAKGTIAEGVDMTEEAAGMSLGIELLDALIQRQRRLLIVEDK